MLAGGLTDGSICLWNPAHLMNAQPGQSDVPPLATLRSHIGPIKGLEFNVSSPNLLASSSTDGDLLIWDIAQPAAPGSYKLVRPCNPPSLPTQPQ